MHSKFVRCAQPTRNGEAPFARDTAAALGVRVTKALVIAILALASGCASQTPSEHERLAALPSPASWAPGSVWTLAIVDAKLRLIQSMTVRLTEDQGESCADGAWRRAEVLAQEPAPHPQFQGTAAYQVSGRAFLMNLTANICDIDNDLRGEMTETGISGSYWSGGPWGGKTIGKFYAVMVSESGKANGT